MGWAKHTKQNGIELQSSITNKEVSHLIFSYYIRKLVFQVIRRITKVMHLIKYMELSLAKLVGNNNWEKCENTSQNRIILTEYKVLSSHPFFEVVKEY